MRQALVVVLVVAFAVPAAAQDAPQAQQAPQLLIAGGPAAVSEATEAALREETDAASQRFAGPDRFATAAAVAARFPVGSPAFIAWGGGAADALAGGPAAAAAGAPILLTGTDRLPGPTADALLRLNPSSIIVLGGPAVVSDAVVAQLGDFTEGEVSRLAGPDRHATAAAIAAGFASPVDTVHVVSGDVFADALPASQAAGLAGTPILLVRRDSIPSATSDALVALAPARVVVVGGSAAVSTGVAAQLGVLTGARVERLSGDTRLTTALAVAAATYPDGAERVYLASGADFPDALAIAPVAAGALRGGGVPDGLGSSFAQAGEGPGDGPLVLVDDPLGDAVRDGVAALLSGDRVLPVAGNSAPVAEDVTATVAAGGTVSIRLLASDDDGDALTYAITSPPAQGTATLSDDTVTYAAGAAPSTQTFVYTASDGQDTSGPATVTVTVTASPGAPDGAPADAAPVVDLDPADATTADVDAGAVAEGGPPLPIAPTATVDDPDGDVLAGLTITPATAPGPPADGADEVLAVDVTGTSLTASSDPVTGGLRLTPAGGAASASEGDFQTALRTLTYAHGGQAPTAGGRSLEVVAIQPGGTPSAPATATLTVIAVNDAPVVIAPAGPIDTDEDTPTAIPGVLVTDVDADVLEVTVTTPRGTLTTTPPGTGDGTGTTVLTGSPAEVSTALGTLSFAPAADTNGLTAITITADDGGRTGTGGPQTATATTQVDVVAVNDAPVLTVPAALSTPEDHALVLTGISVTDVDAGSAPVTLMLSAPTAVLTATSAAGVTVTGSGTADLTLIGSTADLSSYIAGGGVELQPAPDDDGEVLLTVTADDGGSTGVGGAMRDTATVTIDLIAVNDPPLVTTSAGPTAFTEDGGPVPVDPAVLVTDVDSDLQGATITITGDLDPAQDVLALPAQPGITGVWDAATGVLALTGVAPPTEYQAALQAVTYDNTSDAPAPGTRTVAFRVTDVEGAASAPASIGLVLDAVNDAPVVVTSPGSVTAVEAGPAVVVDDALTVTDPDDTSLDGAQVIISTGLDVQDVLGFTDQLGITGTYAGGRLDLVGTASVADYQAALRTITFATTAPAPTTSKVITFMVSDGDVMSAGATRAVQVTPVADPPVITTSPGATGFTEDAGAVPVDPALGLSDPDSGELSGAAATITANGLAEDLLGWVDPDPADDIVLDAATTPTSVVLSGTGTVAAYQAALRAVTYDNPSQAPSTQTRTITFTATDTDGATSAGADKDVTVTAVDDPPTAVDDVATVREDDPATPIDVLANDVDIDGGPPPRIISASDPANGTVVLTGPADARSGLTYHPDPDYCNDGAPTDDFSYTLDGGSTATVAVTVICVDEPPTAGADTFQTVGNTRLVLDAPDTPGPRVRATTPSGTGVLHNDADPEGDPLAVTGVVGCADTTAPFECTTVGGASVTLGADGSLVLDPAAGATTTSFQYTVSDGTASATGTVTVTAVGMAWYVEQGGTGDGRSHSPLGGLAPLDAPGDPDGPGDIIVILGTGLTDPQHLLLEAGQVLQGTSDGFRATTRLNGDRAPTEVIAPTGVAAELTGSATRPLLAATAALPAMIRGLVLTGAGGQDAIDVTATGTFPGGATLAVVDSTIGSPGGTGLDVNASAGGTARIVVERVVLGPAAEGVDVDQSVGDLLVSLDDITTSGAIGGGISLQGTAGSGRLLVTRLADITTGAAPGDTVGGTLIEVLDGRLDATPLGAPTPADGGVVRACSTVSRCGGAGVVLMGVTGSWVLADLDIAATTEGLRAVGTGLGLTVPPGTATIDVSAGPAVRLTGVAASLPFDRVRSTNSPGHALRLDDVTGTVSAGPDSVLSEAGGATFAVVGGMATISYAGAITDDNGQIVVIQNRTGGSVTFSGPISDGGDGDGDGIRLANNAGSSIAFTGPLTLSTGPFTAFAAIGGGTVSVSGGPATLTTTTGSALIVTDTAIAPAGLRFERISAGTVATGPVNGIVLRGTGTAGGLTVTGTGPAGSGGTIRRTVGAGILLRDTAMVSLSDMVVQGAGDDGIDAASVAGLALTRTSITGSGDASGEDGVALSEVTGTVSITDSTLTGSAEHNLRVDLVSTTLTTLSITGSTFSSSRPTTGGNGIHIDARGTAMIDMATVSGSTLADNLGTGLRVSADGSARIADLELSGNTITGNELGVDIVKAGASAVTFAVAGNTITDSNSHGITLFTAAGVGTTGAFRGRVTGNAVGDAATPSSGSAIGNCVRVSVNGGADAAIAVTDNVLRACPEGRGLEVIGRNGTGGLDVTITGNTVMPGSGPNPPLAAIAVQSNCLTTCNTVRADVRSNIVPDGAASDLTPGFISLVESGASTLQLVDTPPASADCTDQLTATNTGSAQATPGCALISGPIDVP